MPAAWIAAYAGSSVPAVITTSGLPATTASASTVPAAAYSTTPGCATRSRTSFSEINDLDATPVSTSSRSSATRLGRWVVDPENFVVTGLLTTEAPTRSPVSGGVGAPHLTSTYDSGDPPWVGCTTVSTW